MKATIRHATIGLAVLTGLTLGCSESSSGGDPCPPIPAGGVTIDEFCPELARVICEGYSSCCPLDLEACRANQLEHCEAGEISSIRSGQSCLDGAIARQCLDAYAQAFDDCLYNDAIDDACRYLWYGHAGPGEPCRDVWWCERGLGCQLEGTAGTCVELPGEGEYCGETQNCQPIGLYCSYEDWICHARPGLGEQCEREDVENICSSGVCFEGTCQASPWC